MGYDWEKIFENKTNKELYDIVIGKVVLSKDAIHIAKQELERRNFDFDNMEANKAAWEISNLIEEEDYAQLEITGRRAKFISIKIYLLIITGIILVYYSVNELTEFTFPLEMTLFYIGLATFLVLLNNFMHKKQKQAHINRVRKFNELKEKLDKEKLLTK